MFQIRSIVKAENSSCLDLQLLLVNQVHQDLGGNFGEVKSLSFFNKIFHKKEDKNESSENTIHATGMMLLKLHTLHSLINENSKIAHDTVSKLTQGTELSKSELEQIQWAYLNNSPYTPWESLHESIKGIFKKEGISEEIYNLHCEIRCSEAANDMTGVIEYLSKEHKYVGHIGFNIFVAILDIEDGRALRDELLEYREFALASIRIKQANNNFKYDIKALAIEWNTYHGGFRWDHDINKYIEEKMEAPTGILFPDFRN